MLFRSVCGGIAVVALIVNAVLILGAMAISKAAFTMPGIAGVILTFGMAVDSNVLIYERLREELEHGKTLRVAIDHAYTRALTAIVDGNVTNLIAAIVLYKVGATEVKGFALTMSIGIISTLFTNIWVTRAMFEIGRAHV